jgi:homoprotocatechuate degradation regulator HpaR
MPVTRTNAKTKADQAKVEPKYRSTRPFNRSLPLMLMKAREGVMQRFRPHLRSHDITEQQWRILRVLAEQTTADMLELATRCCIHPPSLSRTVPLLATRGLVNALQTQMTKGAYLSP